VLIAIEKKKRGDLKIVACRLKDITCASRKESGGQGKEKPKNSWTSQAHHGPQRSKKKKKDTETNTVITKAFSPVYPRQGGGGDMERKKEENQGKG